MDVLRFAEETVEMVRLVPRERVRELQDVTRRTKVQEAVAASVRCACRVHGISATNVEELREVMGELGRFTWEVQP